MERKTLKFEVKQVDEEEGIIEGYAATFGGDPDSYGDIIDAGAFTKTLKENKDNIVSLFNHNIQEPIGLPELKQDSKGLFVRIHLVRGVQRAEETLLLAKAQVIRRLSIGFDTIKQKMSGGIRHLQELKLYDASPVVFAANLNAVITEVKGATSYGNLPLADRERPWDAGAAIKRIKAWAGGDDIDWPKYRKAFFWYDADEPELQGSYKLAFADVIDGELKAIPRGVFAAAGVMSGARGGVNIPAADETGVKRHIERYYAKMRSEFDDESIVAPWQKSLMTMEEIKSTLEHIQALLKTAEGEAEPEDPTPQPPESKEAAELEGALNSLEAAVDGFDERKAEAALDEALSKII